MTHCIKCELNRRLFGGFGLGFRVTLVNKRVYVGFRGVEKTPDFVLIHDVVLICHNNWWQKLALTWWINQFKINYFLNEFHYTLALVKTIKLLLRNVSANKFTCQMLKRYTTKELNFSSNKTVFEIHKLLDKGLRNWCISNNKWWNRLYSWLSVRAFSSHAIILVSYLN